MSHGLRNRPHDHDDIPRPEGLHGLHLCNRVHGERRRLRQLLLDCRAGKRERERSVRESIGPAELAVRSDNERAVLHAGRWAAAGWRRRDDGHRVLQDSVALRRSRVGLVRRDSDVVNFATTIRRARVTAADVVPFEAGCAGAKLGENRGRDVVTATFAGCFEAGQLDERGSVFHDYTPRVFRFTEGRTCSVFLDFQDQ